MLTKLRGGTAELRVETSRWSGLQREERICKQCALGEVEDEETRPSESLRALDYDLYFS